MENRQRQKRQRRTFGTRGPVNPRQHYVVARTEELADFIQRVKEGRSIVIFAPRQTGKTTFFRCALDALAKEESDYFPLELSLEMYKNVTTEAFYANLTEDIEEAIEASLQRRGNVPSDALRQFLADTTLTDHFALRRVFRRLPSLLEAHRIVLIIDEFSGIPPAVVSDFLHTLRRIYHTDLSIRSPYSVGIVGVKNITQLNYDRSISPFNIQDEFSLPPFTLEQVGELLGQYTAETGQAFAQEVIQTLHRQTGGQPFLVNRLSEILTEEMDIPTSEPITLAHFAKAHTALLREDNVNFNHLTTNIRRDARFERTLMQIACSGKSLLFTPRNEVMEELAIHGVIQKGADGMCEIVNPIYQICIMQTFQPAVNGLEHDYFPEDACPKGSDYLTPTGELDMEALLNNFRDFIARVGFRILQVPGLPRESVGQHLLASYLDAFVQMVGGDMYLELPTGRGRMDLVVFHKNRKYIVEIKLWQGAQRYEGGKEQLAAYLKSEGVSEGYYVVFDHGKNPNPRDETETVNRFRIRSYVIPVVQERPSDLSEEEAAYRQVSE